MSTIVTIFLILWILNGIQNIIIAQFLRKKASSLGKKPDYFIRMLADQIFLFKELKKERNLFSSNDIDLLNYSKYTSIFGIIIFILLIFSMFYPPAT